MAKRCKSTKVTELCQLSNYPSTVLETERKLCPWYKINSDLVERHTILSVRVM